MNFPLVDNLAIFKVHAEERIRVVSILHDHVTILGMQHDLLWVENLAVGCFDLGNIGGKLQMVVRSVFEDADLGTSDDK